jgi:putative MATE family efflux protein
MQTLTGVVTGITMGVTVLLGQKVGQKNEEDAANIVGASVLFFAVIGVALSFILSLAARQLAALMQAPPESFEKTVQYVAICSAGTIFIVAYNAISGIFRGIGNSKAPLLFVAVACITNIVGDLLLVAVFRLDAAGAALATVLSQAVSVAISVAVIRKKGFPFAFGKRNIRFHRNIIRSVLKLGSPVALQDLLTNTSFLAILAIMNSLGVIASAGAGIAEKVCAFIMLIPMSFMSSISVFVAQNVGANELLRAKSAARYGIGTSVVIGIVLFFLTFWHGNLLAGVFSKETDVIAAAADYLRAYAIDCLLVSFIFCMLGYCNGHGKTLFVMLQGAFCSFCVRIPFAYFMSRLPEATMFKVGLAAPVSSVVGIVICIIYLKTAKWNKSAYLTEQLAQVNP